MADWISVKERLPEELTHVIVFMEATEQGVCVAFIENGKWLDGESGHGIVFMQQELVTHWMPLPEPPKEARGGGLEN